MSDEKSDDKSLSLGDSVLLRGHVVGLRGSGIVGICLGNGTHLWADYENVERVEPTTAANSPESLQVITRDVPGPKDNRRKAT